MDFAKIFGDIASQNGKRKFCGCPTPKACDNDYQRIELLVCNLETITIKPASEMTVKELKEHAKKRRVNIEGITEKEELVKVIGNIVDDECPICLQSMIGGEWVKRLSCGHLMHLTCAYTTFMEKGRDGKRTEALHCPLCRMDIR